MVLARVLPEKRAGSVEHRVLVTYTVLPVEFSSR